ncbi:MAG TPA: hypothetical protein P5055_15595, partial [Candidatus Paceibacterota bacterium]|nr:hypothetical protein [Candidatus Paceibacterota bacterium]
MQLTNDEAIRLARIIAANFDLAVLATILIKRPKNSDAVVKIILPAMRKEKDLRSMGALSPVCQHVGLYAYRLEALRRYC